MLTDAFQCGSSVPTRTPRSCQADRACRCAIATASGFEQGLSESGVFIRIWDISRYIWIYPLESFRHHM